MPGSLHLKRLMWLSGAFVLGWSVCLWRTISPEVNAAVDPNGLPAKKILLENALWLEHSCFDATVRSGGNVLVCRQYLDDTDKAVEYVNRAQAEFIKDGGR